MIIDSLLDTDLYKFTMQQVVFHKYPSVTAEFTFKLRNYPQNILLPYIGDINKEIDHLCTLRFQEDDLEYLNRLPFITDDYVEFLRGFQLNKKHVKVYDEGGRFKLKIRGSWLNTILFEVPVLAIISEVFCKNADTYEVLPDFNLDKKIKLVKEYNNDSLSIADFGTRRRYSKDIQDHVIGRLVKELPKNFIGTSNVYFAKKYNIKPIGTMAHEFIQAMQGIVKSKDSQRRAFQSWADEYRGSLGIALSDTLGMEAFFNDFDMYFSKLFDGARHDSGDPYKWCDRLIKHYRDMGIDPRCKTAVFSDGLDFQKAIDLHKMFNPHIKTAFGVGTNITNDVGFKAPQIVIKMTRCNTQPVAKISDSKGKQMCEDEEYLKYLAKVFGIGKEVVE